MLLSAPAPAVEWRSQVDAGFAAADATANAFDGGLGKSPYSGTEPLLRAAVRADVELGGDVVGRAVVDADIQRLNPVGLQEAWVGWHPIPDGAWRTRVRAGWFFPETSLETGYDSATWSAERTFSASAVNSWLGQEVRIGGAEVSWLRRGVLAGSPHTVGVSAGAFVGNDPAGTLVAWQGWNLSGGITGVGQRSRLPDLPVYRPAGPIPIQTRNVHVFRELDDHVGGYASVRYGYRSLFDVSEMRYDNRADPLRIEGRQYGWRTRFDHAALRLSLPARWELRAQALVGETLMGPSAVHVDFTAGYLLATRPLGRGAITIRRDVFDADDRDRTPGDPNGESGDGLAVAWSRPVNRSVALVTELLTVTSRRPARAALADASRRTEVGLAMLLRWTR